MPRTITNEETQPTNQTEERKCHVCGSTERLTDWDIKTWCFDCLDGATFTCSKCGERFYEEEKNYFDHEDWCEECLNDDTFVCEDCQERFYRDNRFYCDYCELDFCQNCYDQNHYEHDRENNHDNDEENIDSITRHVELENTSFLSEPTSRTFGVEIEMLADNFDDAKEISEQINKAHGIEYDGSIRGNGYAIEIQTAKMSGKKGITELRKLCKILNSYNARVNKSCGLHVHLDTADFSGQFEKIRLVWLFYSVFDNVILATLPPTRRKNTYCLPISQLYGIKDVEKSYNLDELEKIWYKEPLIKNVEHRKKSAKDGTRYCGINLHTLLAQNNIEIRYHSGTTSPTKILNWIELHKTILDKIQREEISFTDVERAKHFISIERKIETFFELIKLSEPLKHYFLQRIKKFNATEQILSDNPKEKICAE